MFQKVSRLFALGAVLFILFSSSRTEVTLRAEVLPRPPMTEAEILLDIDNRISDEFSVPPALIPRVAFWFDIYTKYSSHHRVIHHQDYPWWIAEVVDTSDILSQPARAQWLNVEKANRHVVNRLSHLRQTFKNLARKVKKNKELTPEETEWFEKIQRLPGSPAKNLAELANKLRVQTGQRNFYMEGLQRSKRYLEFMEKIFAEKGLPTELTRLPLVESSFNENAGSKVGALGIWQVMPNIGQKFIIVNSIIDERRSPYKATFVAARLFRENHKILKGAWPLIVTAYNHGPGGMMNAVRKLGTDDFSKIIERYRSPSFGFASSNFYTSFLAALLADAYAKEIFGDLVSHEFAHVDRIVLPQRIRLRNLVNFSQLNEEEFLAFNPDLRKALRINATLPQGFSVYLPVTEISMVLEELQKHYRIARK